MAGRRRGWDTIGQGLAPPLAPEDIRARLDAIVHRRNQIGATLGSE